MTDDVTTDSSQPVFFDAFASFGPYPDKDKDARWTLTHLLADLDLAGIAGALVTSKQALHYDPMSGNRRLLEQLAPHRDRLHPCWTAVPSIGGDGPDVDAFVAELTENDVRAVRIEPHHFGIPMEPHIWEPLAEALAAPGTLIVTTMSPVEWEAITTLLEVFSDNPVLLADHSWRQWRRVMALMDAYQNLHIEFSRFQANRAVETVAERFGSNRCLFGSGLPHRAPGCARGMLDWSLLPAPDVTAVAGGNLIELLDGQQPTAGPNDHAWEDEITRAARQGKALPCETADAHCHVLHVDGDAAGGELVMVDGGPDGMHALATHIGVDHTAVMSWAGPMSMDTARGNRIVAEAVDRYPDHFVGVSTVNPTHDSPEEIEAVIETFHEERGWPGIKTYAPNQGMGYDDPEFAPYFEYANDQGLYAVIDPGGIPADNQIELISERYPDLGIHLDHCGRSWPYARWAVSLAEQFDNIWLQMNYTLATNGVVEYLVDTVGADRILWGTDAPMRDPRPQASWLAYTRLPQPAKERIFGGNFTDILAEIEADQSAS